MLLLPHARVGEGSKDDPCGRGQFESPTPSKNDAFVPEQVGGTNFTAPPDTLISWALPDKRI
jgi:hypothetical protein